MVDLLKIMRTSYSALDFELHDNVGKPQIAAIIASNIGFTSFMTLNVEYQSVFRLKRFGNSDVLCTGRKKQKVYQNYFHWEI